MPCAAQHCLLVCPQSSDTLGVLLARTDPLLLNGGADFDGGVNLRLIRLWISRFQCHGRLFLCTCIHNENEGCCYFFLIPGFVEMDIQLSSQPEQLMHVNNSQPVEYILPNPPPFLCLHTALIRVLMARHHLPVRLRFLFLSKHFSLRV